MRAAVLHEHGGTPRVEDFEEPEGGDGRLPIDVLAAGLNPVDISLASGRFYAAIPPLPYVTGREGVGRDPQGRRVYFDAPVAPFGSMAERTVIDPASAFELPDGVGDEDAVALGIAGLAAWLALQWRGRVDPGETVLVLGAGGVVGQIAVQGAKLMGAGRVIACARGEESLARAQELGADAAVPVSEHLADTLHEAVPDGIDLVIDPVWGAPAVAVVQAMAFRGRLVQLGQSAGAVAEMPSQAVRGKLLSILGHTNFAVPLEDRRLAFGQMAEHLAAGRLRVRTESFPLERVAEAWERQQSGSGGRKLVVRP